MTVTTSANIHFSEGDVWHRWHPAGDDCQAYGALKFEEGVTVFFYRTAQVDEVIAELVALRAEMVPPVITCSERTCDAKHPETGNWCVIEGAHAEHVDTYGQTWAAGGVLFPAANPPHHVIPGEQACTAPGWNDGSGYVCTAQDGHDGPDHIAYKANDGEYHRWPMHPDATRDEPCSPDAANVLSAAIVAGTPVVVTDDKPASIVGRIVADVHDDSPCPVTGKIVGQVDEDTVEVLWGERQFEDHPGTGSYEPMDALRPALRQVSA